MALELNPINRSYRLKNAGEGDSRVTFASELVKARRAKLSEHLEPSRCCHP